MAVKKTSQKVLSKVQRVAREKAIIRDLHTGTMSYRVIAAKHHVSLPTVNAKARKATLDKMLTMIHRNYWCAELLAGQSAVAWNKTKWTGIESLGNVGGFHDFLGNLNKVRAR